LSKGIIIFRLTYDYKLVAVKPYEKLVYGVQNQLSSASETVPCISVEDIDSNLYGRPESRRFQTEQF